LIAAINVAYLRLPGYVSHPDNLTIADCIGVITPLAVVCFSTVICIANFCSNILFAPSIALCLSTHLEDDGEIVGAG
jgi:hypothetical protein